jgi:hypothetical protein
VTTSPEITPTPTGSTAHVTVVVASRNRRKDLLASLPRHEAPVMRRKVTGDRHRSRRPTVGFSAVLTHG